MAFNAVFNPATQRQRNTRALAHGAAYAAGMMARNLVTGIPRGLSSKNAVDRVIRQTHEPKNVDLTGFTNLSSSSSTSYLLNATTQGVTGSGSRTGRQILLESIRLDLNFLNNTAAAYDEVRAILVWDNEPRGSAVAIGDVLSNTTFGAPQLASAYNFDNVAPGGKRLQILMDKRYSLQAKVQTGLTGAVYAVDFKNTTHNIRLNKKTHYYNTSNGTIADIDSGSLYLFLIGFLTSAVSNVAIDSRVVYRDI
jgi:hypothetical protein